MKIKSYQEFVNESKLTDWFKNKYEQFKNKLKSLKGEAYIKLLGSIIPKDILNLIKSEAAKLTGQKESLIINELFSSPFYTDEEVAKLSDEEYNQYLSKIAKDVEDNPYLLPTMNLGGDEVNTNEISEFLREKGFDVPTEIRIPMKPSIDNIKSKIDSMELNPVAKKLLMSSAYTFLFFMIFVKGGGGVAMAGETHHGDGKIGDKIVKKVGDIKKKIGDSKIGDSKIGDGYNVKINGEKINIDKDIKNLKGENLSKDELEKIIKKGELDGSKIDGIFGQKFINFLNAQTAPKGTDLEGKDFKIVFNKVNSDNYNAAKLSALQQSKMISKNNPPFKVTQIIVVKDGDDKYTGYTFTKVPID